MTPDFHCLFCQKLLIKQKDEYNSENFYCNNCDAWYCYMYNTLINHPDSDTLIWLNFNILLNKKYIIHYGIYENIVHVMDAHSSILKLPLSCPFELKLTPTNAKYKIQTLLNLL